LLSDPEVYPLTLRLTALSAELRVDGSINQPLRAAELQARLEVEAELAQFDLARLPGNENQASTNEEKAFADLRPLYDGLSSIDGRATVQVGQLLNAPFELNKLLIEVSLDHRRLSVDHARLLLAGSEIALQAFLDTGLDCARLDTHLSLSDFSRLEADIAWNRPGKISFDGELLGENLSAIVAFGSVEAIRTGTRSPLKISAHGDKFQVSIIGDGALRENGPELDALLVADVSRMGSLHRWLGTAPGNRLSFRGRSKIRLDDEGLSINDLDTTLGRSDLQGTLRWAGPDSELPLSANLKSNHFDLAKRQLDLLIAPQAKREKFLNISTPIAVTGSFNDYQVGVAPGGFLTTMFRWYYGLIYVPGERYPPDGISTCYSAMNWDLPAH